MAEGRERLQNAVANLTGEAEWYTPPAWVERARIVMGGIDLDPASCKFAQRVVRAGAWFDKKRDGLAHAWRGSVFLNPPYARGLIDLFVEKLIDERADYTQAIALVDARTDTGWFQRLGHVATAIAFPKGRIDFYNECAVQQSSPIFGSAVFYLGRRRDAFAKVSAGSSLVLAARP